MATLGHIQHVETAELGEVLLGLIKNGITFNVTKDGRGTWNIELTGGY